MAANSKIEWAGTKPKLRLTWKRNQDNGGVQWNCICGSERVALIYELCGYFDAGYQLHVLDRDYGAFASVRSAKRRAEQVLTRIARLVLAGVE